MLFNDQWRMLSAVAIRKKGYAAARRQMRTNGSGGGGGGGGGASTVQCAAMHNAPLVMR